ncbi:MAG TPA: tetratricopeptide repeat protein [Chryseolinea sp.]|nr:tetratricopeptide repeat protein [Chryseolinea sp.]HPM31708.1 tetratricopeptide repeat protein [Chryseolinea sp.]
MKNCCIYITNLFFLALLSGCSSEKNTWTSKAYHNTTSHFNGYYYANEEIRKIEKTIWSGLHDDYNKILRLYPALDSNLALGYDKEVQEAVKMASIAIQRHPNSKWVDDGYILVGKARMYSLDWANAIQTFKFVNGKSKDPDARHMAVISLIRTFIEHKELNNAKAAIDFLHKEELSKTNQKYLALEEAYLYQILEDYDKMVRNLTIATPMLGKKDRPGRIYFIIGQVYQKLGFESEAYSFYRKCLSTNPEYEVDFYARLYSAQVTEISRNRNVNAARKSFRKLLKDSKNKEFKDKIYYEMGMFELKQKNINEAIGFLNTSVREGTNKLIDGEAYLRLGEIYYDTLKKYELSQAYYDSAITSLPKDFEGYASIKERQQVLNEFAKHLKTIQWQDSLLTMSTLDSASLYHQIDSALTAQKRIADSKIKKTKRRLFNRVEITSSNNSTFISDDGTTEESVDWYFGNPSAMSLGQSEFVRIWGPIPLEDNWRRSLRSASTTDVVRTNTAIPNSEKDKPEDIATTAVADPVAAEYERIQKEIPRTAEQKKESLKKIEDAYFGLGDIYYFKLLETDNAILSYTKLLKRFPTTEHEPEVLYKLYLIYKDSNPEKANTYAALLKEKYPESTYARILVNPNYLEESSLALEKQKQMYKIAYDYFLEDNFGACEEKLKEAMALGETAFTPNMKLLSILIIGKTQDISQYQLALDSFIKEYPEGDISAYAKKLLDASLNLISKEEKQKGIQYIRSLEEPHYFVLVYKKTENLNDIASATLEKFNKANFNDLKLKTSNLALNDEFTITFVADLPRISYALEYVQTFNEKLPTFTELRNHKFNSFVITKDNFDIFYRTKGLDEYIQFFEKNYPTESR